jgi:uncharacterized membrane protein
VSGPLPGGRLSPGIDPRPAHRGWFVIGIALTLAAVGVVLLLVTFEARWFGIGAGTFSEGGGILGVLLLIWAAFLAVRIAFWTTRARRRAAYGNRYGRPDPALFIARRRYARGEINREQYEQLVRDLQRPPGAQ